MLDFPPWERDRGRLLRPISRRDLYTLEWCLQPKQQMLVAGCSEQRLPHLAHSGRNHDTHCLYLTLHTDTRLLCSPAGEWSKTKIKQSGAWSKKSKVKCFKCFSAFGYENCDIQSFTYSHSRVMHCCDSQANKRPTSYFWNSSELWVKVSSEGFAPIFAFMCQDSLIYLQVYYKKSQSVLFQLLYFSLTFLAV